MCTHKKRVKNPYTGQVLMVNCGKCEACLQAKANRQTNRINNEVSCGDIITFFVTLSYDERFIPYVLKSDLENGELFELPVYRDNAVRCFKDSVIVRPTSSDTTGFYRKVVDTIPYYDFKTGERIKDCVPFTPNLWQKGRGFHQEKMGIIYYPDYQCFCKRLRSYLQDKYPESERPSVKLYCTSEYGGEHFRPHFHPLISTERENEKRVRAAIFNCWQYASRDVMELPETIQIARNAAAYVASYVNKSPDVPESLTYLAPQKKSHSKDFGVRLDSFQLDKILQATDKGELSYSRFTKRNGIPTVFNAPVPKYVINRYFPQFKGLCRLTPDSLALALRFPESYIKYHKNEYLTSYCDDSLHMDTHSIVVRLRNAQERYCRLTGKSVYDFAIDYQRVWNCFKNTIYKMQLQDTSIKMCEKYDNIRDLMCVKNENGFIRNDTLAPFVERERNYYDDVNKFALNRCLTANLTNLYYNKLKTKSENNYVRFHFLKKVF